MIVRKTGPAVVETGGSRPVNARCRTDTERALAGLRCARRLGLADVRADLTGTRAHYYPRVRFAIEWLALGRRASRSTADDPRCRSTCPIARSPARSDPESKSADETAVAYIDFLGNVHTRTPRNYLDRVLGADKAECAAIAGRFDRHYFDGDRRFGYGGYVYDGRWQAVAGRLVAHYGLGPGARILDVGCGKGFLLHDFLTVLPDVRVAGVDVSGYAISQAMPTVGSRLVVGSADALPYPDATFDLVVSINTLHNLGVAALDPRCANGAVARGKYLFVERIGPREKVNRSTGADLPFFNSRDWHLWFDRAGYSCDLVLVFE